MNHKAINEEFDYSFQPELSFLRAPLNSRVPQLSPNNSNTINTSKCFLNVPLNIQQAAILEDFQYVLIVSCCFYLFRVFIPYLVNMIGYSRPIYNLSS